MKLEPMNYLYSQDQIGNGAEGCAAGFFVPGTPSFLTYNRNVMKLWMYKTELVLVREYVLLENVCQVERYAMGGNHDGVVCLFEKAKVSLVRFNPETSDFEMQSLKFFEREEFDIRKEDIRAIRSAVGVGFFQISKYYFGVFPLYPNTFSARVFRFVEISSKVRNPIDFVFLENYSIPTVCLVYNSVPKRYTSTKGYDAIIFSVDLNSNGFHVVDELVVPSRTFKVVCSGAILLFISPNTLLMRSSNSSYTLPLNRMSEAYGSSGTSVEAVLDGTSCFFRGRHCYIFNGNGDIYKVRITMDIKRIINVTIEHKGRGTVPSCVGSVGEFVFLGSVGDSLKLFRARGHSGQEGRMDVEYGDEYMEIFGADVGECDRDVEDMGAKVPASEDEYRRIFSMDSVHEVESDFVLEEIDEIQNVGLLGGMIARSDGEVVFAGEGCVPCISLLSNTLTLGITKMIKVRGYHTCSRALGLYLLSNECETKIFRWDEDFQEVGGGYIRDGKTICFMEFGTGIVQVTPHCCLVLSNDLQVTNKVEFDEQLVGAKATSDGLFLILKDVGNRMMCYDASMEMVTVVSDVACFADIGDKVFVVSGNRMGVFDLNKRMNMFWSNTLDGLPHVLRLSTSTEIGLDMGQGGDGSGDMVVEMCCHTTANKIVLLLRTHSGMMVMYESLSHGHLLGDGVIDGEVLFFKWSLPRCISFHRSIGRAFYPARDMVFIRSSKNLFLLPTDKGHFLYRGHHSLNFIYGHGDQVLQLSKGSLTLCIPPGQVKDSVVFCNRFIARKIPVIRIPKHIEYANGYVVVASCEEVQFALGGGKSCGVLPCTYKFYMDLYTGEYKHISTYELDDNEYVFQVRYLVLNDKQGNNGKSPFLVVCTTFVEGEDRPAKGRLHVLEMISVVPEPENPFKDCKLKVLGVEKTKGSIVQCEEVRGNIVLCLGTKIMIYRVDRSSGIIPVGFHDLHTFTSSISVVKNYILASDIYRGVSLFFLQSRPVRLHLISSSEPLRNAVCVEFLIKGEELSMLCGDDAGTIHIYTYSPNNILSLGGTKLVKRAEINTRLGRLVSSKPGARRSGVVFYSRSNMMVRVSGIEDMTYYKLLGLQVCVVGHLKNMFGLAPRDYLDSDIHLHSLSLKNPIVLHIVNEFCHFDLKTQETVCSSARMSRREALELVAGLNMPY